MNDRASRQTLPPQEQGRQPGLEELMSPRPEFAPRFSGAAKLDGKVALVTGGDSGIGRATAVAFAREGAKIAILYLDEHDDAKRTEEFIAAENGKAMLLPGDIADEGFCAEAVHEVQTNFGSINILVNNAGEQHVVEEPLRITAKQLQRTFATNVFSMFYLSRQILPRMKAGDTIINMASVTAYRGSKHLIDYSATKGAIVAFTRALAAAVAAQGIRVNAVAPGPIWTPLIPASFKAGHVSKFGGDTPLGRPGQPNEVASCIVFLASEESSYVTGQVLHPTGGEPVSS